MIWRISERRSFQDLARYGRRARTQTLWCSFVNDSSATPLRVAFSVGRSVGSATKRNRLRRRLRALVGPAAAQVGIAGGWLLIGARPAAAKRTFDDLRIEIDSLFTQLAATPGLSA